MSARIRVRIARIVSVVSLTAAVMVIATAPAMAKPVLHPVKAFAHASALTLGGWVFPLIVSVLIVATVLVSLHAPQLRAIAADRRRRLQPLRTSAAIRASSGDASSDSQAA